MMRELLAIALGGSLGALSRYGVEAFITAWLGRAFPYGTLFINVAGSFFIGVMYVLIVEHMEIHPLWRHVLMVGFLGAFTTFSTFSLETVRLMEMGQLLSASIYIVSSVVVCLCATWLGLALARGSL